MRGKEACPSNSVELAVRHLILYSCSGDFSEEAIKLNAKFIDVIREFSNLLPFSCLRSVELLYSAQRASQQALLMPDVPWTSSCSLLPFLGASAFTRRASSSARPPAEEMGTPRDSSRSKPKHRELMGNGDSLPALGASGDSSGLETQPGGHRRLLEDYGPRETSTG